MQLFIIVDCVRIMQSDDLISVVLIKCITLLEIQYGSHMGNLIVRFLLIWLLHTELG